MGDSGKDSGGLVVSAWGLSDVGLKRERNEDSFHWEEQSSLYVVADGMGGHAGGGMASRMAVETISRLVKDAMSADEPAGSPETLLRSAIREASHAIYQRSVEDRRFKGMGTTVVALWLLGKKAYIANVGDSRGYLMRRNQMIQLTVDHSLVGEQIRAGILSAADAKTHRLKNIITRSVGFQEHVEIDIIERNLCPGDVFVLCSDGLTNMVDDEAMCAVLLEGDLSTAPRKLIDAANRSGGEDNITLLVVKAEAVPGVDGDDPDATEEWDEPTVQV
jgi:PPM family protein phosphatase